MTDSPNHAARQPAIDILRALAALLVVAYHVVVLSQWQSFPVSGVVALLVRIGWVGVDLFLVISGFVIAKSAFEGMSRAPTDWRSGFAQRRWYRIAPLYFLTSACFVALVNPELLSNGLERALIHIGSHVFFVHNIHPATHGSINGANWSVALEMQFYLLVLWLAPWLRTASVWKFTLAFVGIALAWRGASTLVWIPGSGATHQQHVLASQLFGTLDSFVGGILLARLQADGVLKRSWLQFGGFGVLACAALFAVWQVFWSVADYWSSHAMVVGWRSLLALGCALLVACMATLPARLPLAFRPLTYLGEISYGIYLWHLPVLLTLLSASALRERHLMLATVCVTCAMAALSWHLYESVWIERGSQAIKRSKGWSWQQRLLGENKPS